MKVVFSTKISSYLYKIVLCRHWPELVHDESGWMCDGGCLG